MNHDGMTGSTAKRITVTGRSLLCLLIGIACCPSADAELPKEIRVVSYNIYHGQGMDGQVDLLRTAKVLLAERPDIVALQAVDQKTGRSGGVDQAAALGKLTGMTAVFSRAIDFDGGGYGNAVLSKLPVRSQETVKLKMFDEPMPELAEQRAVQMVELGAKDGPGLWFLCTSLDYRWESKEQFESARTIKELVAKHDKELAIMACTLHANPGNRTIREFAKEWKVAGMDRAGAKVQGEGEGDRKKSRYLLTYPSDKPDSWADFIMCRPAARWRVVELRVIEEKVASNHRPVLAVLRRVDEERVEKVAK